MTTDTANADMAPRAGWDQYARHIEIVDHVPTPADPAVGPRCHVTAHIVIDGERVVALRPTSEPDTGIDVIGVGYPLRGAARTDDEPDWEMTGGARRETRLTFWVAASDLQLDHDRHEVRVGGHLVLTPPLADVGMVEHPENLPPETPVKVVVQVERVTVRAREQGETIPVDPGVRRLLLCLTDGGTA